MRKFYAPFCLGILVSLFSLHPVIAQAPGTIVTLAGDGYGSPFSGGYSGDGAPATGAELFQPNGVALDKSGNLYLADENNDCIRKVNASTGIITDFAGICGTAGYSGDGGPATSAALDSPARIVFDSAGNLYITDAGNYRVRKVTAATGKISTIAGDGTRGYSGDSGPATNAQLTDPAGIALDSAGNLYIADPFADVVRKVVLSTGIITTYAGNGTEGYTGNGGNAADAELYFPVDVAVDPTGNLYILDQYYALIRKVTASTGAITTVIGKTSYGFSGDGGPASNAQLDYADGITFDSAGNLYIADTFNCRIRKVTASTGIINTIAGDGLAGYSGDGEPATEAELNSPSKVVADSSGNVYFSDTSNNRIRKVLAGGLTASATAITVPISPALAGQPFTLTAQVTGPLNNPTPTGTVSFYDGTTDLGSAPVNSSGVASFAATLSAGTHNLSATYSGNAHYNPSLSLTWQYYVASQVTATPTLSPGSGTYESRLQVTISDTSPRATIYYTTDGSTPSPTYGTAYLGSITLNASETIRAIAFGQQSALSSIVSATYVIHLPNEAPLAPGKWAWESGGKTLGGAQNQCGYGPITVGLPGVYGTLGTPASGNVPGSRYAAMRWTDKSGNFWLFGGQGFTSAADCATMNDLWEFNPATLQWTWEGGSSNPSYFAAGTYGTLGKFSASNVPGSRTGGATWTDASGHLWLFGGSGYDSKGTEGELNDLWEYNPSNHQWAWMGGSDIAGQSGVYGTRGVAKAGNIPGNRFAAASWTDLSGHLWLFGGFGVNSSGNSQYFNDLWEYNPATNEWAWMCGSKVANGSGTSGTEGVASVNNIPGGRWGATTFIDHSGKLWLFGGFGYGSSSAGGLLNDLWEFNPSTKQWTWVTGSNVVGTYLTPAGNGQIGVYGTLDVPGPGNTPGSRVYSVGWTDSFGHFWLFGGDGIDTTSGEANEQQLSDLWEFNPSTGLWAWMGGSSATGSGVDGIYGSYRVPSASNLPGSRMNENGWADNAGNLWLFGGEGRDSGGSLGLLNDLWEYKMP